ncbi:MAG: hypothetical protein ABDH91_08275 [Bacteroidia bacterium]
MQSSLNALLVGIDPSALHLSRDCFVFLRGDALALLPQLPEGSVDVILPILPISFQMMVLPAMQASE